MLDNTADFESFRTQEIHVGDFVLKVIPVTIKNAVDIFTAFHEDPEQMIFWMPDGLFESPEITLVDYYRRNNSQKSLMFGIFCGEELLGEIGFTMIAIKSGKVEIGYWLKKSARGQGIVNKLIPVIEKIAFSQEWCHKIQLHCDAENIASKKIAEKNGYQLEGVVHQDAKWPDGSLRDKLYFGKFKK